MATKRNPARTSVRSTAGGVVLARTISVTPSPRNAFVSSSNEVETATRTPTAVTTARAPPQRSASGRVSNY
jgi:hypothetical protein